MWNDLMSMWLNTHPQFAQLLGQKDFIPQFKDRNKRVLAMITGLEHIYISLLPYYNMFYSFFFSKRRSLFLYGVM